MLHRGSPFSLQLYVVNENGDRDSSPEALRIDAPIAADVVPRGAALVSVLNGSLSGGVATVSLQIEACSESPTSLQMRPVISATQRFSGHLGGALVTEPFSVIDSPGSTEGTTTPRPETLFAAYRVALGAAAPVEFDFLDACGRAHFLRSDWNGTSFGASIASNTLFSSEGSLTCSALVGGTRVNVSFTDPDGGTTVDELSLGLDAGKTYFTATHSTVALSVPAAADLGPTQIRVNCSLQGTIRSITGTFTVSRSWEHEASTLPGPQAVAAELINATSGLAPLSVVGGPLANVSVNATGLPPNAEVTISLESTTLVLTGAPVVRAADENGTLFANIFGFVVESCSQPHPTGMASVTAALLFRSGRHGIQQAALRTDPTHLRIRGSRTPSITFRTAPTWASAVSRSDASLRLASTGWAPPIVVDVLDSCGVPDVLNGVTEVTARSDVYGISGTTTVRAVNGSAVFTRLRPVTGTVFSVSGGMQPLVLGTVATATDTQFAFIVAQGWLPSGWPEEGLLVNAKGYLVTATATAYVEIVAPDCIGPYSKELAVSDGFIAFNAMAFPQCTCPSVTFAAAVRVTHATLGSASLELSGVRCGVTSISVDVENFRLALSGPSELTMHTGSTLPPFEVTVRTAFGARLGAMDETQLRVVARFRDGDVGLGGTTSAVVHRGTARFTNLVAPATSARGEVNFTLQQDDDVVSGLQLASFALRSTPLAVEVGRIEIGAAAPIIFDPVAGRVPAFNVSLVPTDPGHLSRPLTHRVELCLVVELGGASAPRLGPWTNCSWTADRVVTFTHLGAPPCFVSASLRAFIRSSDVADDASIGAVSTTVPLVPPPMGTVQHPLSQLALAPSTDSAGRSVASGGVPQTQWRVLDACGTDVSQQAMRALDGPELVLRMRSPVLPDVVVAPGANGVTTFQPITLPAYVAVAAATICPTGRTITALRQRSSSIRCADVTWRLSQSAGPAALRVVFPLCDGTSGCVAVARNSTVNRLVVALLDSQGTRLSGSAATGTVVSFVSHLEHQRATHHGSCTANAVGACEVVGLDVSGAAEVVAVLRRGDGTEISSSPVAVVDVGPAVWASHGVEPRTSAGELVALPVTVTAGAFVCFTEYLTPAIPTRSLDQPALLWSFADIGSGAVAPSSVSASAAGLHVAGCLGVADLSSRTTASVSGNAFGLTMISSVQGAARVGLASGVEYAGSATFGAANFALEGPAPVFTSCAGDGCVELSPVRVKVLDTDGSVDTSATGLTFEMMSGDVLLYGGTGAISTAGIALFSGVRGALRCRRNATLVIRCNGTLPTGASPAWILGKQLQAAARVVAAGSGHRLQADGSGTGRFEQGLYSVLASSPLPPLRFVVTDECGRTGRRQEDVLRAVVSASGAPSQLSGSLEFSVVDGRVTVDGVSFALFTRTVEIDLWVTLFDAANAVLDRHHVPNILVAHGADASRLQVSPWTHPDVRLLCPIALGAAVSLPPLQLVTADGQPALPGTVSSPVAVRAFAHATAMWDGAPLVNASTSGFLRPTLTAARCYDVADVAVVAPPALASGFLAARVGVTVSPPPGSPTRLTLEAQVADGSFSEAVSPLAFVPSQAVPLPPLRAIFRDDCGRPVRSNGAPFTLSGSPGAVSLLSAATPRVGQLVQGATVILASTARSLRLVATVGGVTAVLQLPLVPASTIAVPMRPGGRSAVLPPRLPEFLVRGLSGTAAPVALPSAPAASTVSIGGVPSANATSGAGTEQALQVVPLGCTDGASAVALDPGFGGPVVVGAAHVRGIPAAMTVADRAIVRGRSAEIVIRVADGCGTHDTQSEGVRVRAIFEPLTPGLTMSGVTVVAARRGIAVFSLSFTGAGTVRFLVDVGSVPALAQLHRQRGFTPGPTDEARVEVDATAPADLVTATRLHHTSTAWVAGRLPVALVSGAFPALRFAAMSGSSPAAASPVLSLFTVSTIITDHTEARTEQGACQFTDPTCVASHATVRLTTPLSRRSPALLQLRRQGVAVGELLPVPLVPFTDASGGASSWVPCPGSMLDRVEGSIGAVATANTSLDPLCFERSTSGFRGASDGRAISAILQVAGCTGVELLQASSPVTFGTRTAINAAFVSVGSAATLPSTCRLVVLTSAGQQSVLAARLRVVAVAAGVLATLAVSSATGGGSATAAVAWFGVVADRSGASLGGGASPSVSWSNMNGSTAVVVPLSMAGDSTSRFGLPSQPGAASKLCVSHAPVVDVTAAVGWEVGQVSAGVSLGPVAFDMSAPTALTEEASWARQRQSYITVGTVLDVQLAVRDVCGRMCTKASCSFAAVRLVSSAAAIVDSSAWQAVRGNGTVALSAAVRATGVVNISFELRRHSAEDYPVRTAPSLLRSYPVPRREALIGLSRNGAELEGTASLTAVHRGQVGSGLMDTLRDSNGIVEAATGATLVVSTDAGVLANEPVQVNFVGGVATVPALTVSGCPSGGSTQLVFRTLGTTGPTAPSPVGLRLAVSGVPFASLSRVHADGASLADQNAPLTFTGIGVNNVVAVRAGLRDSCGVAHSASGRAVTASAAVLTESVPAVLVGSNRSTAFDPVGVVTLLVAPSTLLPGNSTMILRAGTNVSADAVNTASIGFPAATLVANWRLVIAPTSAFLGPTTVLVSNVPIALTTATAPLVVHLVGSDGARSALDDVLVVLRSDAATLSGNTARTVAGVARFTNVRTPACVASLVMSATVSSNPDIPAFETSVNTAAVTLNPAGYQSLRLSGAASSSGAVVSAQSNQVVGAVSVSVIDACGNPDGRVTNVLVRASNGQSARTFGGVAIFASIRAPVSGTLTVTFELAAESAPAAVAPVFFVVSVAGTAQPAAPNTTAPASRPVVDASDVYAGTFSIQALHWASLLRSPSAVIALQAALAADLVSALAVAAGTVSVPSVTERGLVAVRVDLSGARRQTQPQSADAVHQSLQVLMGSPSWLEATAAVYVRETEQQASFTLGNAVTRVALSRVIVEAQLYDTAPLAAAWSQSLLNSATASIAADVERWLSRELPRTIPDRVTVQRVTYGAERGSRLRGTLALRVESTGPADAVAALDQAARIRLAVTSGTLTSRSALNREAVMVMPVAAASFAQQALVADAPSSTCDTTCAVIIGIACGVAVVALGTTITVVRAVIRNRERLET
jgi:hypothetical protein